jgi:2-polyprenyl-6-methoxyphenol hydroxylase-like FAD-dependent oxidoreductase
MTQDRDVVIVGGGFTGMTAAAALADGTRRVTVLEARSGADPRFRGELIHPPGVRDLGALGLLDAVRARGGAEVVGFAMLPENRTKPVLLPYDPSARGVERGYAIEHPRMVDAMRAEVAQRHGVEVRVGERVAGVVRDARGRVAGVRTANGEEIRAGLTVVAEGRLSRLRSELGLEGESRLLSYSVALLAEGAELPHPGHGHVVLGGPGPVLAYPIGGAVRFCIDVPADTDRGREAITRRLREEYAPKLPALLRDALHRALERGPFELCASQQVRTDRCVVEGAALVGDAGGCSHPLTASGMTLCLNDVRTLARALDGVDGDVRIDAALGRYERERYRYARVREILTERLYDIFLGHDPGLRALRSGVLDYWEDTTRAREASMALLSGQRADMVGFAREFARVFGYAARTVVQATDQDGPRSLRDKAAVLGRLTRVTASLAHRAARTVVEEVLR